eukprot:7163723-Ditylum_brightwellii.AAC.1
MDVMHPRCPTLLMYLGGISESTGFEGFQRTSSIEAVRSAVSSSTDLVKVPLYDFVDHMEGGTGATGERDWLINSNVKKMVQDSMFKSH